MSVVVIQGKLIDDERSFHAVMDSDHMKKACPDVWVSFLECAAFVNWRRVNDGGSALLVVAA